MRSRRPVSNAGEGIMLSASRWREPPDNVAPSCGDAGTRCQRAGGVSHRITSEQRLNVDNCPPADYLSHCWLTGCSATRTPRSGKPRPDASPDGLPRNANPILTSPLKEKTMVRRAAVLPLSLLVLALGVCVCAQEQRPEPPLNPIMGEFLGTLTPARRPGDQGRGQGDRRPRPQLPGGRPLSGRCAQGHSHRIARRRPGRQR